MLLLRHVLLFNFQDFEKLYSVFIEKGIDEIYCLSVNDAFVMNAWAKSQKLKNVKVIPDGSGEFTRLMGMLVKKDNLGIWSKVMEIRCFYKRQCHKKNVD